MKGLGVVGATGVAAMVPVETVVEATAEAAQTPAAASAAATAPVSHAYTFFSPPEAAFIEAAVNTLIPADDLTPNGTECGVAVFMDRQFGGAWGSGDRAYLQGPWRKGTPTQGYQLPLTPAELIRGGIAAANVYCRSTFQKDFDRLTADQRVQVLQGLEQGKVTLTQVPAGEFFNLLLNTTMEGFFADPVYGGNRDKASWKMLGFPGVIAVHGEHIKTYRNKRYEAEATSIEDLS